MVIKSANGSAPTSCASGSLAHRFEVDRVAMSREHGEMTESANQPHELSNWQTFCIGGGSIIACLFLWATVDKHANLMTTYNLTYGLAFLFNFPHFLLSYFLLYGDYRKRILSQFRYFWAAVIVPVLLISGFVYAMAAGRTDLLGYSINLMFFSVGWHYVKQVFGCVVVTSARKKIYFSKTERRLFLSNLFALWFLSWLGGQQSMSGNFFGLKFINLGIAPEWMSISYAIVVATALPLLISLFRKYVNTGARPATSGLVAVIALYVWYLPVFSHPAFSMFIPLFHSLQYMAFVWSLKLNKVTDQVQGLEGKEWRKKWLNDFVGFGVAAAILAALVFDLIPRFLDNSMTMSSAMGATPFYAVFAVFLNVHHYFIDNVMWRSDNEELRKYLFTEFVPRPEPQFVHQMPQVFLNNASAALSRSSFAEAPSDFPSPPLG